MSPTGNGYVLNIVVYRNLRLFEVLASDILDSDRLSIIFHLLGDIITRNFSGEVNSVSDWERFQSLASELISPRIQFSWGKKPTKRSEILL
jgi:hypothetical protein